MGKMRFFCGYLFLISILISLVPFFIEGSGEVTEETIEIDPNWKGIPDILENSGVTTFDITGPGGMINETYEPILSVMLWNEEYNNWATFIDNGIFSLSIERIGDNWTASVEPVEDMFGTFSVTINVTNDRTSTSIGLDFEIIEIEDPPKIIYLHDLNQTSDQFSVIRFIPVLEEVDENEKMFFSLNFDGALDEQTSSVLEQLPHYQPEKDIEWSFENETGEFFWDLSDQNIWKSGTQYRDEVFINFMILVEDEDGETDSYSWTQTLKDVNEMPPSPAYINIEPYDIEIMVGDPVHFWVDEIIDPDGDRLTYKWDFGDGATAEGMHVNHTYSTKGFKTAQMWVEDYEYQSEKISYRIEIFEEYIHEIHEPPIPPEPEPSTDGTLFVIIIIVTIVIIVVIVIVMGLLLASSVEEREKMRRSN